jgi:hypothetical protein
MNINNDNNAWPTGVANKTKAPTTTTRNDARGADERSGAATESTN